MAAFDIHRAHITARIVSRGGVDNLLAGPGIQATVAQYVPHSCRLKLSSNSISRFGAWRSIPVKTDHVKLTYPKLPLSQKSLITMQNLPEGFVRLCQGGSISWETVEVLKHIASCRRRTGRSPDSQAEPRSTYGNICFRDWYTLCPALNLPNNFDGPPLEKFICLALLRYNTNVNMGGRPRLCVINSINVALKEQLPRHPVPFELSERRALLWTWMMAVDCWCIGERQLTPEAAQLLRQIKDKFPETKSWCAKDFECLGTEFLWNNNISKIVEKNWNEPSRLG